METDDEFRTLTLMGQEIDRQIKSLERRFREVADQAKDVGPAIDNRTTSTNVISFPIIRKGRKIPSVVELAIRA